MLHIAFDIGIVVFTANETLRVEDGVLRVSVERVFRAVADTG